MWRRTQNPSMEKRPRYSIVTTTANTTSFIRVLKKRFLRNGRDETMARAKNAIGSDARRPLRIRPRSIENRTAVSVRKNGTKNRSFNGCRAFSNSR